LLDERDDVALGLAPEAVEELLLVVDGERRGLLGVEGAQADVALADPLQGDVLTGELDEVGGLPDARGVLGEDAHQRSRPRSAPSPMNRPYRAPVSEIAHILKEGPGHF